MWSFYLFDGIKDIYICVQYFETDKFNIVYIGIIFSYFCCWLFHSVENQRIWNVSFLLFAVVR